MGEGGDRWRGQTEKADGEGLAEEAEEQRRLMRRTDGMAGELLLGVGVTDGDEVVAAFARLLISLHLHAEMLHGPMRRLTHPVS